jgi:hypothetical protein
MKLSLKALELLFDLPEDEFNDKALQCNWQTDEANSDSEAVKHIVPNSQINKQLDYILSDHDLSIQYSTNLSQNLPILMELTKTLPKSMCVKFEKIVSVEFEKNVSVEFEKKMCVEFEKKADKEDKSTKISNSAHLIAQPTDNKEVNTVPKNHCAISDIPQSSTNKGVSHLAQCTVPTTVPNRKNAKNHLTTTNIKQLDNFEKSNKIKSTVPNSSTLSSKNEILNLDQVENSNEWIDIETTVAIGAFTRRTLFRKIKDETISSIKVPKPDGGLKTFINVNSLPIEFQQKWKMQLVEQNGESKELTGISSGFMKFPEESRRKAFAKETIIKTYLERREAGRKQALKLQTIDMHFQKDINQKLILVNELKTLGKYDISPEELIDNRRNNILSIKVIKKWLKLWNDAGQNLTVLCDKYGNCGKIRSWDREVEVYVAKLAIHPNGFNYKDIHNKTLDFFGQNAPSYFAVKRFIKTVVIPQNKSLQAHVKGKKSVKKISPYVSRINDAFPGQWISDGYVIKFQVYSPYHMHNDRSKRLLLRPLIVYWLDTATELIAGYSVSYSERFDVVISSFDHAVNQYGVPTRVYTDNAGSFHNVQTDPHFYAKKKKDSAGKRTAVKLLNSGYPGFFEDIGVEKVTWATPGNPQAKKIEPYNHKIFDVFEREQFTYVGKTPEQRPEAMNMTNHALIKKHADKIMSWELFLGALEEHIEKWNNTKRKHLNDMSAKEYYLSYSNDFPFKKLSPEERFLKLSARKTLKVRSKQLELLGNLYQHPSLEAFIDTEIQVIYNVRDLHSIHIATIEGRVLEGTAKLVTYGSHTNQIQTADAIHAKNYYEKQNKALYFEIIQQGGLTNKIKPNQIDHAYGKAMHLLETEGIDHKIKEIHKNSVIELDKVKSKADPKPKKIHKPENPRPIMAELDRLREEREAKAENEPKVLTPEEEATKNAKELIAKIKKEKGLDKVRRY